MKTITTILLLLAATITALSQTPNNGTPQNGWAKYEIAKRTADNPLVNKSFLKGNLNRVQLSSALSTPYVDTALKVYDEANILSEEEIAGLQTRIRQFINTYNTDMVIVTIDKSNRIANYNGNSTDNFAMDFYDYNDFGKGSPTKDGYDGVIMVINMQHRFFSIIDVGTPNKQYKIAKFNADQYVSKMTSDLKAKRYYTVINTFINSYESDLIACLASQQSAHNPNNHNGTHSQIGSRHRLLGKVDYTIMIIVSIAVGAIAALAMVYLARKKRPNNRNTTYIDCPIKKDSFQLSVKDDTFVSSETERKFSPKSETRKQS